MTGVATAIGSVAATLTPDRGYKVFAQGLVITRDLSRAEWQALGQHLATVHQRTLWAIGDWLFYGEGRGAYGEFYGEAAALTGRSFESLSQLARVSKAFPIETRTAAVPWSFYREALRLATGERARALRVAQDNRWTRDDLADYINGRDGTMPDRREAPRLRGDGPAPPDRGWTRSKNHHHTIQCPSCGFRFERRRGRDRS